MTREALVRDFMGALDNIITVRKVESLLLLNDCVQLWRERSEAR